MPAGDFALPDLSKPPPGFPPAGPALPPPLGGPPLLPTDMDLTPSVPYYDLPAGLMAPLVKVCGPNFVFAFSEETVSTLVC